MNTLDLSRQFHEFRASEDWKEFELALIKLIQSPASKRFQAAAAPATRKMELGDYFNLLAGFLYESEPDEPGTMRMSSTLCYREVYEYDNRPTMMFNEDPTDVLILIGDKSFSQTIPLFMLERASMTLRFGRAILDGISRLEQLNSVDTPTGHRLRLVGSRTEIPIQFYNVMKETDKYTGEQTTYCDFYLLWSGDLPKPNPSGDAGLKPELPPVELPAPVPAERAAAAKIRELGGWYELNEEGHVVEINMVYHEAGGLRYDNEQVESDEAMRNARLFPRLKRLLLKGRQATDAALARLVDLRGLEELYVWDAVAITDAGTGHLAQMTNLASVYLGYGGIGDGTLAVLSKLPRLTQLIVQGNLVTDDGLAHLAHMKQLETLWVGSEDSPISDKGLEHLAGLTHLQELGIGGTQITDAGLRHLEKLSNLKRLFPGGPGCTTEGFDRLRQALPQLKIFD